MRQYERNGVTVDQCGDCRGIFLDRGELERLVDAETRWSQQTPSPPPRGPQQPYQQPYQQPHQQRHDPRYGHKRRKHWIEELFD
jgi:uncharacterized protein